MRSLRVSLALLVLAASGGCAADPAEPRASTSPPSDPSVREVDEPEPRLAVSYDGGVLVVRADDGEVLADEELPGYLRLSPAGDDRHVVVSREGGWSVLDGGSWTADHGDHGHSWADDPSLRTFEVAAEEPGHVVPHHGTTALYDDGTGRVTVLESHDLADPEEEVPTTTWEVDDAHHGVAVPTGAGGWVHTVGTTEERSGVRLVDADGEVVAETDDCPGVHGEASAREAVVLGCEDGAVVVAGGRIRQVDAPDPYGRIGNQAGDEDSPFVLGDYKVDEEAELERPTRVSVIDTRDASLRLVDLDTSYSFRSLARDGDGNGVVLGTDGALHVVDVRRARVTASVPVVDRWREPLDWTEPRPNLEVVGRTAYVTEPSTSRLHVVDLERGEVVASHELPEVPDELVALPG
jgi:hypothetical protein